MTKPTFRKVGSSTVVLVTGRQTGDAYDLLTADGRPAAVLATEPPYNIEVRDDRWGRLVTHRANVPVFGLPVLMATEAFFREPIVEEVRARYGIRPLEFDWSTFVASKHTKIDSLISSQGRDLPDWQQRLLVLRSLFADVHCVLEHWNDGSDVPSRLQSLEADMRSVRTSSDWVRFLHQRLPFLPEYFLDHLHVTADDDMILSLFGCSEPGMAAIAYGNEEQKRALEWVSKLLTVTWGIQGCLGDFFNTIFLLNQRAIELNPDRFEEGFSELMRNPPRPGRDASHRLAHMLQEFTKMVVQGTLVPFLCDHERLLHLNDFEGDDDKARLVYLLYGVKASEIVQMPGINTKTGWTQAHIDAMATMVASREDAQAYTDSECANGAVLKRTVSPQ